MTEQTIAFLNQYPSIFGIPLAVLGGWELFNYLFHYEAYKQKREELLRGRLYELLGARPMPPRIVSIVGSLFILVGGLTLIGTEIYKKPRIFWLILLVISVLAFFITLIVTALRRWFHKQ